MINTVFYKTDPDGFARITPEDIEQIRKSQIESAAHKALYDALNKACSEWFGMELAGSNNDYSIGYVVGAVDAVRKIVDGVNKAERDGNEWHPQKE